jgi:hypothetical protein
LLALNGVLRSANGLHNIAAFRFFALLSASGL